MSEMSDLTAPGPYEETVRFEWLPPDASPNTIVKLLEVVMRRHGWTPALAYHLDFLLSQTAASDWRAGGRPMVCLSVEETAWTLRRSTAQIRRNENRLMQLGALVFRHSPNRQRYIKHNADGVIVEEYGLDLSPIVGLIPKLRILAEAETKDRAERYPLRWAILSARRSIKRKLENAFGKLLISSETEAIMRDRLRKLSGIPPPTLQDMRCLLASLQELKRDLTGLIDGVGVDGRRSPQGPKTAVPRGGGTDSGDNGGTSHA